jgi:inner membrane protein
LEPVTHFLYGACLSRAGFTRKTALATLTMTLAAEAPDIDMLWYLKGSAVGFAHHRGFTHTVFGIPFVAAAVLLLVFMLNYLYRRWRPLKPLPEGMPPRLRPRWGVLFGLACLAGYSHILLDFTNNYGVRPLWPLLNRWVAWDIIYIIEPVILTFLVAGLLLPALFGLVNSEIGARTRGPRGRGGAITALVLIALFWGVRDYEHRRAVAAMSAIMYHDRVPIRVGVNPYQINPFKWYGVAETESTYESVIVNSSAPEVDPQGTGQTYFKSPDSDVIRAAKSTYLGGAFLDWARFPQIEVEKRESPVQYIVSFRDIRYAYPERRGVPLSAYVILDGQLRSIDEGFYSRNAVKNRMESTSPEDEQKP